MEIVGTAVDQFDAGTASTLFWETVPVLLQRSDRDDQVEELSARLLTGHTRNNHSMRVLRIHLFSEDDLFFLHTLEVSEEDFQTLKIEQGILVDFANFSGKIVDLLKRCIASREEDVPRFRAVLALRGGESVFKMVETNDFKQLPHITLSFRCGNDLAIKSFLAFRLTEVKDECRGLSGALSSTTTSLQQHSAQLEDKQLALADMETRYSRLLLEADASAKDASAAAHEQALKERDELTQRFERVKRSEEEKHAQMVGNLQARVDALDKENRVLRDQKYSLDSRVSELSHKLGSSEGHVASCQDEIGRLQKQLQSLSRDKTEADVELTDLRAKLAASTEKANLQESTIRQQTDRIQDLDTSVRQLESHCADLKETTSGHEGRLKDAAAEVVKGNSIIEKVTGDLQISKEKLKRKQAIIVRQEDELQGRDKALEVAEREAATLKRNLDLLRQEHASLGEDNEELRTKLEDSKQQLKGNEQMIRWLNAQVNEAQLAGSRAPPTASRYTFKPAASASEVTPSLTYARPSYSTATTPHYGAPSHSHSASAGVPFQPLHTANSMAPRATIASTIPNTGKSFSGFGTPQTMPTHSPSTPGHVGRR